MYCILVNMQRGVLNLTREELHDLAVRMNIKTQKGTNLYNKMLSAWLSNKEKVQIEVSADELDQMYDAIAIPEPTDTEGVKGARKAINDLINKFHQEGEG